MSNDPSASNNRNTPAAGGQSAQDTQLRQLLEQFVANTATLSEVQCTAAALPSQMQGAEQKLDSFGTTAAQIREEVKGNREELSRVHQAVGDQKAAVQADLALLGQQFIVSAASQPQNVTQAMQQRGAATQGASNQLDSSIGQQSAQMGDHLKELKKLNEQIGKLVSQGDKPAAPLPAAIGEVVRKHFGPGGSVDHLIQLPDRRIGSCETEKWLVLPKLAAERILAEAEAENDPKEEARNKAELERARNISHQVKQFYEGLAALGVIPASKQDETAKDIRSSQDEIAKDIRSSSSFNSNVLTMSLSNVAVVGCGVALAGAVAAGWIAVAPALAAFAVGSVVNVVISRWCKSNIESDFRSKIERTFDEARAASDPVSQIFYIAKLAHMVQSWKWRAVIGKETLRVGSSALVDSVPGAMGLLQTALEFSLRSLYSQNSPLVQATKNVDFDQKLDLFKKDALEGLKNRWQLIPELLDTGAKVVGFVGAMGGLWAAIPSAETPSLFPLNGP